MAKITVVRLKTREGKPKSNPSAYMVVRNHAAIGFIEKYPNTRTETHPWKAFGAKDDGNGQWQYDATVFQTFYGPSGRAEAISFLGGRQA